MCTNSNSDNQHFIHPVSTDTSRYVNGAHSMVTSTYPVQVNSSLGACCDEHPRFVASTLEDRASELNQLVQDHQDLVHKIVRRYEGRGLERANLIDVGRLGLMLSAPHFEPAQGVRFSTHASWWIKDAIKNALRTAALPTVPELC